MKKFKRFSTLVALLLAIAFALSSLSGCDILGKDKGVSDRDGGSQSVGKKEEQSFAELGDIPAFSGEPYVILNNNQPKFDADQLVTTSYEKYSELDSLGRCGVAMACVGKDIMPTEDREDIGSVKPSGWQSVKYDIVNGKYLYNRCHLIGFQLTGENANEKNLITGTRYMNVDGMLPFENMVADYVKETGNHVLLRVTPVFNGNELVARGVVMEAYSVEDNGEGVCFNVYVYNNQPGITINYATGESVLGDNVEIGGSENSGNEAEGENNAETPGEGTYVINTNTKKFHKPTCSSATSMSAANRREYTGPRATLLAQGYSPCGSCKP